MVSDTATISYSASPLRDCAWISSTDVNGAVSTRRVSFVPSVGVIANSYLSISVPFWFGSLMNLAVSSPACTAISVFIFLARMWTVASPVPILPTGPTRSTRPVIYSSPMAHYREQSNSTSPPLKTPGPPTPSGPSPTASSTRPQALPTCTNHALA